MDSDDLRGMLYDICELLLSVETANSNEHLQYLQSVIQTMPHEKALLANHLADIIWLHDLECTSSDPINEENRRRLAALVGELHNREIIGIAMLLERLEPELLELAGILSNAQLFLKRQIRINTNMLYKQQKYNLLHEESEGFSKLIFSLFSVTVDTPVDSIFDQVMSLIGFFDLDPNRVLDLILDVFIKSPLDKHPIYLSLLKKMSFPKSTVESILGFKAAFLVTSVEVSKQVELQPAVMLVAALLIKHGVITLEGLYSHLSPTDDETLKAELVTFSKNLRMGNIPAPLIAVAQSSEKADKTNQSLAAEHQPACHDFSLEVIKTAAPFAVNQKALLTEKLLLIGDFRSALLMLQRIPDLACLPSISRCLCLPIYVLLHQEGIYRLSPSWLNKMMVDFKELDAVNAFCKIGSSTTVPSVSSVPALTHVFAWLSLIKEGLYMDTVLLTIVCRTLLECYKQDNTMVSLIESFINAHLLPALTLIQSNPAVVTEAWNLISVLSFERRYALYRQWRSPTKMSPLSQLARRIALADIRRVMRRLTKENVRQYGRLIAKISHSNPIATFPLILEQLQAYDNLIHPVVDSLKYLTPLGFDVMAFVLIEHLSDPGKERLKDDGTNLSSWLQSLALFAGLFFKRYSAVDARGLLQYMVSKLKDGHAFDLVILSEMIHRMAGIDTGDNISEPHLDALCGGALLQEVMGCGTAVALRSNKRSAHRLLNLLKDSQLATPLWILIAKEKSVVSFDLEFPHLKLITNLVDQVQTVLYQYGALMTAAMAQGISITLPSIAELTQQHGIDFDIAAFMHRSIRKTISDSESIDLPSMEFLTPRLLSLFWFWSIDDIFVPVTRYNSELIRLKTLLASPLPTAADAEAAKLKKEKDKAPQTILALEAELKERQEATSRNRKALLDSDDAYFVGEPLQYCQEFFLRCVYPRAVFSPLDALFAARFLRELFAAPKLPCSLVAFTDAVVHSLPTLVSILTEREAHNYGRFLAAIFADLSAWRASSEKYQKDVLDIRPASAVAPMTDAEMASSTDKAIEAPISEQSETSPEGGSEMDIDLPQVMIDGVEESTVAEEDGTTTEPPAINWKRPSADFTLPTSGELDWEAYRHRMFLWHSKMQDCFMDAFASGNHQRIRNSIIILTRINDYFPLLRKHGRPLEALVVKVRDGETREDLKVLASRYSAMLQLKQSSWMKEGDFHALPEGFIEEETKIIVEEHVKTTIAATGSKSRKRTSHAMDIDEGFGAEDVSKGSPHKLSAVGSSRSRSQPASPPHQPPHSNSSAPARPSSSSREERRLRNQVDSYPPVNTSDRSHVFSPQPSVTSHASDSQSTRSRSSAVDQRSRPDRDRDREREKDKDRERDREREKEKEKEREREKERVKQQQLQQQQQQEREREKERAQRDRERERERLARQAALERDRDSRHAPGRDRNYRERDRDRDRW